MAKIGWFELKCIQLGEWLVVQGWRLSNLHVPNCVAGGFGDEQGWFYSFQSKEVHEKCLNAMERGLQQTQK